MLANALTGQANAVVSTRGVPGSTPPTVSLGAPIGGAKERTRKISSMSQHSNVSASSTNGEWMITVFLHNVLINTSTLIDLRPEINPYLNKMDVLNFNSNIYIYIYEYINKNEYIKHVYNMSI